MSKIRLELATDDDAAAIAELRNAAANELLLRFGDGHWMGQCSGRGVASGMKRSRVFVARRRGKLIATLTLQTRKPWAIDTAYFTPCKRPLYLINMAVTPKLQRTGVGRGCLEAARELAENWPADAIRLDAYDAAAGAGEFYARCGYRERGRVVYRSVGLVYYELIL